MTAPRPVYGSRLRHVVPASTFNKFMDSSEGFPSEHDSICNAILVSYETDEDEVKRFSKALPSVAGRPRCQRITIKAKHGPIAPSSLASADISKSCNVPIISRQPISREPLALKSNNSNVKIYSYDDLDIPNSRPRFSPTSHSRRDRRSASISEGFESFGWLNEVTSPAEPTLPFFPPPVRSPTPPGLPSFGSLAALSYVPPRRPRASKGRSTQHGQSPRISKRVRSFARNDEGGNGSDVFASLLTGIGRFFNLIPPATPRSERLPPGIVARADDGTYIRARFGHRHSGHGVGAGPASIGLESHPFHRRTLATARTLNQANNTGAPGRNAQSRNRDAVDRPQTVYRYPPYRSMLDVPAPKKRSAPRQALSIDPPPAATIGPSSSGNPAFHSADTRHGHFEPGLSEIRENPKSPPHPPPGGYSAPLNMEFSMDGRGDDGEGSNPPGPPPPAPPSPTPVRQDDEVFQNDEPHCFSCVAIKTILVGSFKRFMKPCRSGCCAPSLEELHAGNPDLRDHVNRRPNNEVHDTNTHSDTRRNADPNVGSTSGENSGHTADHVTGDNAGNDSTNDDANHSDGADSTETVKPVRAADDFPSEEERGPSTQPRNATSPCRRRSTSFLSAAQSWPFSGR